MLDWEGSESQGEKCCWLSEAPWQESRALPGLRGSPGLGQSAGRKERKREGQKERKREGRMEHEREGRQQRGAGPPYLPTVGQVIHRQGGVQPQ